MHQMDENYWKELAASWIRQQTSQTSEILESNRPQNTLIHQNDDNSVTDMEIEDVKDEDDRPKIWSTQNENIQQHSSHKPNSNAAVNSQNYHLPSRFQKQEPRKTFLHQLPAIAPDPPMISLAASSNSIDEQLHATVDMDMDESDNDNDSNSASSTGNLDVQKKKTLPTWLKDGLEKMKREKELENARMQEELKQKEDEESRKKLMEEALKEIEQEKMRKSKYESSESESEEREEKETEKVQQKIEDPEENDEEAYEKMMLLVRKTLTTVLLEVTNEKIQEISSETLAKYRKKANSSSVKPAIIGLGLGVYSSSSDEDSDDEGKSSGANSDLEPESVLKDRIRQKALSFEKRGKDVKERLARMTEIEEEVFSKKKKKKESEPQSQQVSLKSSKGSYNRSDSDDEDKERPKVKSNKDGEEKFEQIIYSISASASGSRFRGGREKRTRFSDPRDRSTHMTHVSMVETRPANENGSTGASYNPPPPPTLTLIANTETHKKEKDKKKRRNSSDSSSESSHRKKHKKHKKSSKKSSKKRDKSKSRSRSREREKRHKSDRQSIESKTSVRSSESRSRRTRSRSRSRDRHRRRY